MNLQSRPNKRSVSKIKSMENGSEINDNLLSLHAYFCIDTCMSTVHWYKLFFIGPVDSPTFKVYKFEVGSAVQYGNPVQYGTIKQLIMSPLCSEQCASIEWVSAELNAEMSLLSETYYKCKIVASYSTNIKKVLWSRRFEPYNIMQRLASVVGTYDQAQPFKIQHQKKCVAPRRP